MTSGTCWCAFASQYHIPHCADEVLIQIAAVKAALNQTAASLIDSEMRSCMNTCMAGSADDRLERVTKALSAVLKSS